jgi:hypothetical protein
MRKAVLIGGALLLGVIVLASALGYHLAMRQPLTVTQTALESIVDSVEKPSAFLSCLAFREDDGRAWQYGIITYGRKVPLQPGPGSFKVFVDGAPVEISPADGGLWAIGPDRQVFRLDILFQDVSKGFERGESATFLESSLWKDRLKPMLGKYRWPE